MKLKLPDSAFDPEPPPLLGSWRNIYIAAIVWLFVLIAIFYAFTRYYA
jgi:hypothetical protein